ncbi:MAG: ATP-binding cassette domain-containing protein [Candidatus Kerfeldbacteria bacterium]
MLKVTNLTKKFKNFTAVDDVSFEAKTGEIFGLLGPNGAGKTTTIRVLATVLKATSGTANIAGFDINDNSEEVRKNIGVLTAEIGLYDRFTARENMRYFGQLYGMGGKKLEERIDELVYVLHMERFADRRAGKFSTGMKQKVAISRSIIHDPKVIIFDEPTAGLDVLASQTVISFMKESKKNGKLVILSTHDMNDAEKLCDNIAIIHRAKVVAKGTVSELLQKTNQDNLEGAFTSIVGTEAAIEAEKLAEEKQLSEMSKKKKFL